MMHSNKNISAKTQGSVCVGHILAHLEVLVLEEDCHLTKNGHLVIDSHSLKEIQL